MSGFLPFEEEKTIEQKKADGDWPPEWISTKYLVPYIKRLSKTKIDLLEIGTGKGESACYLLENVPNLNVWTFDPYKAYQDWNGFIDQVTLNKHMEVATKNFEGRLVTHIHETFDDFNLGGDVEGEQFDVVFIDGDHAEEAVYNDLKQTYPLLKAGGIMAVHDTNLRTVLDAVYKFRDERKIRNTIQMVANACLFWYKE